MINKVFCIGFNKTGTSSMHQLFLDLGLRSYHGYYSHFPVTDPIFGAFQCFSDGDQHPFELLDSTFPASRFILTTRRLDDWLVSRIRHIEYRRSIGATGPMRQEYEAAPQAALREWIRRRLDYHRRVASYFSGRDGDLLVIDICGGADGPSSAQAIARFLGIQAGPDIDLPHENARDDETESAGAARRPKDEVRAEVRMALDDFGLEPDKHASVFP